MLARNEATWDRALRVVVGVALLVVGGMNVLSEPWDTGLEVLAFVPLLTGLFGWCPFYALIGRGTCPRRG